jgi:hypothetical protein
LSCSLWLADTCDSSSPTRADEVISFIINGKIASHGYYLKRKQHL